MQSESSKDRDIEIFTKDLSIILSQISVKNKELEDLDKLIETRYNDYRELSLKEKPLEDALLARKLVLQGEINSLENEIPGILEHIAQLKIQAVQEQKDIDSKQRIKAELEKQILSLETTKDKLTSDNTTRSLSLDSINSYIQDKEDRISKLTDIELTKSEQIDSLDKTIKDKQEQNVKLDKDILDKTSYIKGLEDKDIELQGREEQINLMEERLTPEYKETFGRYANI